VKTFAATFVVLLATGGDALAHRLDEYLQATRVSIARGQIALEVDLTPGVSIAPSVIATIDTDRDGTVAPAEAEAYGRALLSDLAATLDDDSLRMTLVGIDVPSVGEMRDGLGTIRVRASASVEAGAGRHQLRVSNHHRPDTSVYMVNALVPDDTGVALAAQSRDPRQREFLVEYTVTPRWAREVLWLGFGIAGLLLVVVRRKEKRKTNIE
jgi:hypothetical protein